MTYPALCQRFRMGGSISGSSLTGGTSIETHGRNLVTWNGIQGWTGKRGANVPLLGVDGSKHMRSKPYRERLMTLALIGYDRNDDGLVTLSGQMEELEANIDLILELLGGAGEQVILERDYGDLTASGLDTRWIKVEALDKADFLRGPVFGIDHASYAITQPVVAAYPFWQTEAEHTQAITGAGILANAGNARSSTVRMNIAADGTVENSTNGDLLTIADAAAAVSVDVGLRSIISSAVRADRLMTPNRRHWFRLEPGDNAVDTSVATTFFWRDSFHS